MKGAMVVTWTGTRPGREHLSLAYGREVDGYFEKFVADGTCTAPKWFFARTGPSVWVVEGELEDLLMISATPEAENLTIKGPLINEGFTVEFCSTERDTMFANFEGALNDLKIG
jgi:hypothetical protein